MTRRIVIGVTGASGAPYAARVLDFLRDEGAALGLEPHVVFTKFGRLVWDDEVGTDPRDVYPFPVHGPTDMLAPFASGSAGFEAMAVVPCSAGTLARVASGVSTDLVSRAADVMLKERRKLVLVLRESPYNLVHLRNMVALTEAGAVVMPASPSFYSAPKTLDELLDTVTARVLDQLGVPNDRMRRWTGELQGREDEMISSIARRSLDRAGLGLITDKVLARERLTFDDGVRLFESPELAAVGALANVVRERLHGDRTWFNRNLHINATNVCEASCIFCSFARLKTGDPGAYTMQIDEAVGKLRALRGQFVTEVHTVNGLNPDLPWSYYLELLRALKAERPDLHVKGFTAVEVHYFAEKYGKTYEQVLVELREAGLGSLPGGGAEIFAARARKKLCADKVSTEGWLEVHRTAHRLGMRSNCTMLFGSIERLDERVDHILRLRELQDETGGFQTFIPLKFHNENNRLAKVSEPTDADCLKTMAVSRLLFDNVAHVKAYWPMLGVQLAQLSLSFGVDDLDGTVREERIYHMAGAKTPQELGRAELISLIRRAGRVPIERDTLYRVAAEA